MTTQFEVVRFNIEDGDKEIIGSYKSTDIIRLSQDYPLHVSGDDSVLRDIPITQRHRWSVHFFKVKHLYGAGGNTFASREEIPDPRIYFEDL